MKVFAIGDLHLSLSVDKPMDVFGANWLGHLEKIKESWQQQVSSGDVVLLPGDFSWAMSLEDAAADFNALKDLPGTKILIKGNHDYWWNSISKVRSFLPQNFIALQNDAVKIGKVIFCGSRGWLVPGSADFTKDDKKIYLREVERLKMSFAAAKKLQEDGDIIICVMHFPPFNSLREDNELMQTILKYGAQKVVYGHLHGGKVRADLVVLKSGIEYILTSCDLIDFKLKQIF